MHNPAPAPSSVSSPPLDALAQAIASLEAQRALLGDAAVDAALAPLKAALGSAQSLRQVSVLFLDVVGSTVLSQHLDPEDMSTVMDELLAAATAIVKGHGGRVLQYAGDSMLAVFGADGAREDDAERAVRCGLALADEGAARAVLTLETHGHAGLHVRVGVHTGPVLLGGGVSEEASIRGHTVHVAARMEQNAPRGRLRISHDTWQQVRGVFDVQAQPPLAIKGQDVPMQTWLVTGIKPRAFRVPARGIEGAETALVGRGAELDALVAAFDAVCATGTLHMVTLLADAGLGKSRLVHELQHRLDAHPQTFWLLLGRALPGTRLQPYGLLRDVLAWRLQIADSDPAALARSRLVEGLLPLLGGAADDPASAEAARTQAEVLGQLLGMDFSASPRLAGLLHDSRALRDRGLAAFATVLRRLAASDGSPVVMLLEDLQWADDASLDALWALRRQAGLPVLMVCTARSELAERRPTWAAAEAPHGVFQLSALDGAQRRGLTQALLARLAEPSPALEALIEQQAEGNPFYAEELIKMLLDDGVIVVDGEQAAWRVLPEKLDAARIPLTLVGVLQARIDTMALPERRALQRASIVGPVFWDDVLVRIDPGALAQLAAVQRRGMLMVRPDSAFEGTRELGFQHHLLHQVTYDTVLKPDKRSGHAAAAAWLAERVGDRQAEYLAITAEHYDRAGDHVRALDWFERAGEAATLRFANQAALDFTARMLSMPELTDPVRRHKLYMRQRELADLTGQRALQRQASDCIEQLAVEQGRTDWMASMAANRALLHDRLGERDAARHWAERAAALSVECNQGSSGALAEGELAWLAREHGDHIGARQHLERAFAWCPVALEQWISPRPFVYDIQMRLVDCQIRVSEGDLDGATAVALEAGTLAAERGVTRLSAFVNDALAQVWMQRLQPDAALQHASTGERAAAEVGQNSILASLPLLRARVAMLQADFDEALVLVALARQRQQALGSQAYVAETYQWEALALLASGRPAPAADALRQSLTALEGVGTPAEWRTARLLLALALVQTGQAAQALALAEPDLPALHEPDALEGGAAPLTARAAAWLFLQGCGDPRAATHLALGQQAVAERFARLADAAERARLQAAWREGEGLRLVPRLPD